MGLIAYTREGRPKAQGQSFAPQGVSFAVAAAAQTSIGTSYTLMGWDTKDYDPYNWFDLTNDRWQPKIPGYYRLSAHIRNSANAAGETGTLAIYKNGVLHKNICYNNYLAGTGNLNGSCDVYLNGSTDYVDVRAFYSVARTTSADITTAWFHGELIGASMGVSPEPWHTVGATGEPAYANSWVTLGPNNVPAAFFKDPEGLVHIRGLVTLGTASTIFTLPAGYRPASDAYRYAVTMDTGITRVDVNAAGTVVSTVAKTGGGWVDLSGISPFRAEQ